MLSFSTIPHTIEGGKYSNQTSVEANTYKILGAAMHMAGDVYAHRSMVPTNSVNSIKDGSASTAISGNYYVLAHFGTGEVCSDSKIEEKIYNALTDKVENKENCKTGDGNPAELCKDKTWQCYANGVQRGIMEFKDIARFTTESYRDKYEDNANFYKSRFSIGTNYTTKYILDSFVTNAALGKELFLPGVFGTGNETSYAIRLNALKILYKQLNFEWDAGWTAYTTSVVR